MTRVLAHRGDTRRDRENTVAAFLAAVDAGADGVELDVRRSADGALVVHHDAVVEGHGAIAGLGVRDLPGYVALLDEALDVLAEVLVNVEIKNDPDEPGFDHSGALAHQVATVLESRGDVDRVVVSSFDLATVDAVRRFHPSVPTGLLVSRADPFGALDVAVAHGHSALHPFVLGVTEHLVDRAHEAGLEINTWTVNARHDLERVAALGVDAVITDQVDLALEVAGARLPNGGPGPTSA